MCQTRNSRTVELCDYRTKVRVDACMQIHFHTLRKLGIKTKACCCGHGKYKPTMIIELSNGDHADIISGTIIPRKVRFYVKDKQGFYYIPEVENGA